IYGGVIFVFAISAALRLWRLGEFPAAREHEFVNASVWAIEALETGRSWTWKMLTGRGAPFFHFSTPVASRLLYIDAWALLYRCFGVKVAAARLLPTSFGLLGILALWHFGRRIFGDQAALCACFLMAISPYMVALSRNTWPQIILT